MAAFKCAHQTTPVFACTSPSICPRGIRNATFHTSHSRVVCLSPVVRLSSDALQSPALAAGENAPSSPLDKSSSRERPDMSSGLWCGSSPSTCGKRNDGAAEGPDVRAAPMSTWTASGAAYEECGRNAASLEGHSGPVVDLGILVRSGSGRLGDESKAVSFALCRAFRSW